MPDLIEAADVIAALDLSPADEARVGRAVAAASQQIRSYCGRYFTKRIIDELITSPLSGRILLAEYPIVDVIRVSSSKTTVFSVSNIDTRTNQRAICKLTRTGDSITGFTTTGLYLERWASGAKLSSTILFSSLSQQTIQALAQAVNAQGGGWQASPAQADGSGPDYALWPVSELRSGQGALGALQDPADFEAWTDDLDCQRDDAAGILTLSDLDSEPFRSTKWGPSTGLSFEDDSIRGQLDGVRVVYEAGFDPLPADLADAVIELTKANLERKGTSSTILSERTESWTITNRDFIRSMPDAVRETLALYRSHAR